MDYGDLLKIKIGSKALNTAAPVPTGYMNFKAYLKSCDIEYRFLEQTMSLAPLSFLNNKVSTRLVPYVNMSFDVIGEDKDESVENLKNLDTLVGWLKPKYFERNQQYLPYIQNSFGLISLTFRGHTILKTEQRIYVDNFNYKINEELGYVESREGPTAETDLVPIAYNLTIKGRILRQFSEDADIRGI